MADKTTSETRIYIKYNGSSQLLINHRFYARQLGNVLLELDDLIVTSNRVLNGADASINVMTQAEFHQGSFGIELIVQHLPEGLAVLKSLGLIAAPVAGSLIYLLKNKGTGEIKDDCITIDERTNTATVNLNGTDIETTPEAIELIQSRAIRKNIHNIINLPLMASGVEAFEVMDSFEPDADKIVEVSSAQRTNFSIPPTPKSTTIEELETIATVEFLTSNKNSGTSGWRMMHLGENVVVKIKDEGFMEAIKKEDAPSIYGVKFKVELHTKKNSSEQGERFIYTIIKVLESVID